MQDSGFGIRLAAAAVDALFLYGLSFVAGVMVMGYYMVMRGGPPKSPFLMLVEMLGVTAVLWLAYVALEVFGRASLAKRMFKLRIAGDDHASPRRGRLVARAAFKYSPLLTYLAVAGNMYWWIARQAPGPRGPDFSIITLSGLFFAVTALVIGGFFASLGHRRQALHDMVAGTVVLRPGEGPAGFAPIMVEPVAEPVAAPAPPAADAAR